MAKEYTVKSWKAWEADGQKVQDQHGNYKGSVTFEEHNSEPVDATFKTEPQVGDKKFGDIADYQTKSGNTRTKFQRADRPREHQGGSSKPDEAYWADKQAQIKAQWAIGQAVQLFNAVHANDFGQVDHEGFVESNAKTFYAMVDRVKDSQNDNQAQEDLAKAVAKQVDEDQPINLDDIPF